MKFKKILCIFHFFKKEKGDNLGGWSFLKFKKYKFVKLFKDKNEEEEK